MFPNRLSMKPPTPEVSSVTAVYMYRVGPAAGGEAASPELTCSNERRKGPPGPGAMGLYMGPAAGPNLPMPWYGALRGAAAGA